MTILRMMKAVAYCGVALVCIVPMVRLWQADVVAGGSLGGLVAVALFEAVAVPLAWAGLSWGIVRRGEGRDRLILALLFVSISTAWAIAVFMFVAFAVITAFGRSPIPGSSNGLSPILTPIPVILVLSMAVGFLGMRLRKGLGNRSTYQIMKT